MDLRRIRIGEVIAAVSGVSLAISLWLDWYEPGASAWELFTVSDVLLAIAALGALGMLPFAAAGATARSSILYEGLMVVPALVALITALIEGLGVPAIADGRGPGAWLGMAGAAGVMAGTLVAMRDERLGPGIDSTGVPVATDPVPEQLPTPPA